MAITTICAVVATLRIVPSRSQFFQYESASLSCEQPGNSSDWRVKRNTSTKINEECFNVRDRKNESSFFIHDLYPSDSGVYWCESAAGECSNAVNITVTRGSVILESPVLPVMEGDDVTLRCRNGTPSSSNLTYFYKDGLLIRSSSTGNMTIRSVSKSDEGFYKCNITGAGQSPDSLLTVRGRSDPPHSPGAPIVFPVVVVCLSLVSLVFLMLLCLWRSHKVRAAVSYTDVTIIPTVQPQRIRDEDTTPTFYSTVKPGNT
ncbi:high affinity immunoglobulin gamma Fc receptor I-like isoform 2-T2 [Symphorus nematophorus]